MQFPSFQHILKKTTLTINRFPLVLLSALIAVSCAVYLADLPYQQTHVLFNIILVSVLGIPLFTVLKLMAEQKSWSTITSIAIDIAGILLLLGYYFTLPNDVDTAPYKHVYRYILYVFGVHLLVAIGPYWCTNKMGAFWQYNKTIFLRFITAVFFTGVLCAGLAVALGSVEVLLEVDVEEIRYLQLFIILTGIFNTWFFLAGIPPSLTTFERVYAYPKGLKIFTQNILIPLVIIYLGILYLYSGKIVLQWAWPEGWVTYLVLSFSIVGILALLLLYPIREKAENRWIKQFSSSFFIALVPLVILLLLAILRRIWEYSFTVERYFVLILGLWLAGVVLYFLVSKTQNIKVIPASLCILMFLVSFGPWGAFSVSEHSQINRLQTYLNRNNLFKNGMIRKTTSTVSFQDRKEISNIIRYLNDTHGLNGIQPWFAQDFDSLTTKFAETDSARTVSRYNRPEQVVELMGIEYTRSEMVESPISNRYTFQAKERNVIEVRRANWLIKDVHWPPSSPTTRAQKYSVGNGQTLVIGSSANSGHAQIYLYEKQQDTLAVHLGRFIRRLSVKYPHDQNQIPAHEMTLQLSNESLSVKIYFKKVQWSEKEDSLQIESVQFDLALE